MDSVSFLPDDFLLQILSLLPTKDVLTTSAPVLEVLLFDKAENDNVTSLSLTLPSLQRFIYYALSGSRLVMNMPSLKYFKLFDFGYDCMIEYLPEIVEAHVEVICSNTDDILRSLASVKRLLLCLPSEPRFPTGSIFHQLVHLEFCTCETEWDLLMSMLHHSPKLQSLKLNEIHDDNVSGFPMLHWDEPSSVPETLMFGLEIFEWRHYRGWKIERELATFILKHSRSLKIATFSPPASTLVRMEYRTTPGMKYCMLAELARVPRGSTECELVFG